MPRASAATPLWVAGGAFAAWLALSRLEAVLTPLVLAWFIAYAFDPALDLLERRRVPRVAGILILLAGLSILFAAAGLMIVPALARQIQTAAAALPGYARTLQTELGPWVERWTGQPLGGKAANLVAEASRAVQDILPGLAGRVLPALGKMFASAWGLVSGLLALALIPVMAFYLLLDFNGLGEKAVSLVPLRRQPEARRLLDRADETLGAFVRGQLTVCAVLAVVYSVGLMFVGIDMPWVVGGLAGGFTLVPYLGPLVGVVTGTVLALLKFHDLPHLLGVWGVFSLGQVLEGFVLTPRIVGDRVGLHPLGVLVAILAGGELFGFTGVLLAVPAAAVLRVALAELLDRYRSSALYRAGEP